MEHTPSLERQVRDMLQFQHFWSHYKARLQHKEGTLPEFQVDFSPIGPEKPSTDEKEFYQFFIHFSPEETPNKDYFSRTALGNQLMKTLFIMETDADKFDRCDYNQSNGRIHL